MERTKIINAYTATPMDYFYINPTDNPVVNWIIDRAESNRAALRGLARVVNVCRWLRRNLKIYSYNFESYRHDNRGWLVNLPYDAMSAYHEMMKTLTNEELRSM